MTGFLPQKLLKLHTTESITLLKKRFSRPCEARLEGHSPFFFLWLDSENYVINYHVSVLSLCSNTFWRDSSGHGLRIRHDWHLINFAIAVKEAPKRTPGLSRQESFQYLVKRFERNDSLVIKPRHDRDSEQEIHCPASRLFGRCSKRSGCLFCFSKVTVLCFRTFACSSHKHVKQPGWPGVSLPHLSRLHQFQLMWDRLKFHLLWF